MVLTVTLNAAIDKRYVVDRFQTGAVNRVAACTFTPGGKGLNVSKTAAILGESVVATGFAGGYAGNYIEHALKGLGVKSAFCHLDQESRSCINIWDRDRRVQTEFLEPGPTVGEEELLRFETKLLELAKSADIVVMSGSVPAGLNEKTYQRLIRKIKPYGMPIILDTSGGLLENGIESCPTMIKPNMDEIRMLTGKTCESMDEVISAAQDIHEEGVEIVAVSLGGEGSLLVCSEGVYRAKVPNMDAVNTVGCGDAMIAGFVHGLTAGFPVEEILRKASAVSAAAALREETGYFRMEDMERLLQQVEIFKL
ncbi:MAG: 1-phosphofructokinase [Lachnospiraceae bacterium]|nr:1-phosphofructokinase [Lachnospiraceae bacterium]